MEKRWTPEGWEWNIEGTWTLGRKAPPFTSFITPKPSPFAWPAKLSTEVSKYPELVDPELFAQAKSYSSHIQRLTAEGFTPAAAAKTLQQRGYRFFGWSKKLLSNIQAPSIPPQQLTPEFVSRWNREALLTRLSTAVKQGPFEPIPMPEFYRSIAGRAGRFGLEQELLSRIGPDAPRLLQDIISPPSWSTRVSRLGKSIWGAPRGYKVAAGIAIGLLGLYALQPGSYFNGFSESGIGPQKRKELTDFGSGYRGLDFNRDKTVSPVERKFGRFARALKKYGVEVGTAHKRIYIPKDIISEEELTQELGFTPVKIAIPEAGQSRFESFRHPNVLYHLHEHDDVWVMHEDVHPSATMVFKKWMAEKARGTAVTVGGLVKGVWASMSHIIEEGIPGAYYYLKGLASETDDMRQRIEQEISGRYKGLVKRWRKEFSTTQETVFSGFGRAYNSIEGLFHGGQAEKKRRELTDFGSGFIRAQFGSMRAFEQVTASQLKSKVASWLKEVGISVTTRPITGLRFKNELIAHSDLLKKIIHFKAPSSFKAERYPIFLHEVSEMAHAISLEKAGKNIAKIKMFGTHISPAVIAEEALLSQKLGPKYYEAMKAFRFKEITKIEEELSGKKSDALVAALKAMGGDTETAVLKSYGGREAATRYTRRVRKIYESVEKRGNRFSGFDDNYNTIQGFSHRGVAGKIRKFFGFGSGWRGLFGGVRKLFTQAVRPFTFAGRVERVYKGLIKSSLKAQGIPTRNLVWDYIDILEKGALDITLMAKTKAGNPLAMITRSLSPQEVYLKSMEVGVKGAGLGKQIYSREALALRKLGYKAGTRIVSPVSSPITARWQAQLYGSQSVNKLVEDDFINRLVRGKITKEEFTTKYAGEFAGELRFDGFQEQGLSSLFRKRYGFGSGAIWKKILTFSRRLFGSSTSKTSFEKLTSVMTESEVANVFGREAASFNPAQIRSGLMDKWYIERKLGLPQEVVTRSPVQIRKEMEAGERLYRQQVVSGKIFSRNELRTMNEVEWAEVRNNAIAKREAQRQKNALKNAQIKEQMMGAEQKAQKIKKQNTLHLKAQQDFWKNSIKTGRGHVVKSSSTIIL